MIGLGVGIDYALFIVTRHRERLGEGLPPDEAAARACATVGQRRRLRRRDGGDRAAARWRSPTSRSSARSGSLGGGRGADRGAACALTLLPALLAILGERIESLRVLDPPRRTHDQSRTAGSAGRAASGSARGRR